jgi:hypothetical protein
VSSRRASPEYVGSSDETRKAVFVAPEGLEMNWALPAVTLTLPPSTVQAGGYSR